MTPFVACVVKIIRDAGGSLDAHTLRERVMAAGFGMHPAGVAMNLTKLAYKGDPVSGFVNESNQRIFVA